MSVHAMTMVSACRQNARVHRDRVGLVDGGTRETFAQFHARTNQLAHALIQAGIRPADRVATLLPNGIPFMELYFATAKMGAILQPMNWRLAPPELAYQLENARPSRWFVHEMFMAGAEQTGSQVPITLVTGQGILPGSAYEDFLGRGADQDLPEAGDGAAPWLLIYTSGTTGRPKGCMLSQRSKFACDLGVIARCGISERDTFLHPLPLFHVGGLGLWLAHFAAGAVNVMVPRADPELIVRALAADECTGFAAPPPLLGMIVEAQRRLSLPLRVRWNSGFGGGESPEVIHAAKELLGSRFVGVYGQTEAGNIVTTLDMKEQLARPTSCGRTLPHLELQVQDDHGRPLPPGEVGEICVRGPSVMNGYWELPEATHQAIRNGWLLTGDMAHMDEDGYVFIVDRKKDVIKSGGENVYSREVELRLAAHPAVAECVVVGVPDDRWGEAVKAFIVPRPGAAMSPGEVADWCRQGLAGYKRPRYVEFLAAIPRNYTGKILKADLRALPVTPAQSTG